MFLASISGDSAGAVNVVGAEPPVSGGTVKAVHQRQEWNHLSVSVGLEGKGR